MFTRILFKNKIEKRIILGYQIDPKKEFFGFSQMIPPSLLSLLKPHQVEAVDFLQAALSHPTDPTRRGAILAHSMGLGKTLTTIAFLLSLGDALCRVLVVVPKSLLFHWEGEISRWDVGRRLCVMRANDGAQYEAHLAAWAVTARAVLLCGYETLSLYLRDHRALPIAPYLAVFDEAHRLRNSQSLRTLSAAALGSERRLMLTGTPMQNHIAEYCSMLEVAHPGWWPREKFKFMFEIPIVQGQARDASEYARGAMNTAVVALQRALAGVVHRRGPELLTAALPPLQVRTLVLQISRAEAVAYNVGVAAAREAGMFAVRHRVSGVDANSVKVRVAMDIIETARSLGEKVIVFSQWLAPLHLLHDLLGDATITSSILSGDTSALDRERLKERFNNVSDAALVVLLIATRAGGERGSISSGRRALSFSMFRETLPTMRRRGHAPTATARRRRSGRRCAYRVPIALLFAFGRGKHCLQRNIVVGWRFSAL